MENNSSNEIEVHSLYKSFKGHEILKGINLNVKKSSSLVILGPSGTGKSVLIKTIIGLLKADAGKVIIKGQNTTDFSTKKMFKLVEKCGFLFQGGALFDSLTIQDNIVFFVDREKKMSKSEKKAVASSKLEEVGLSDRLLKMYPSEISGGMQKRVSLARTICGDPEIIFFDEPTTGLDPIMSNIISELIIKARDKLGATTITITHDIESAYMIATDVALLYEGKIKWIGKKEEMKNSGNEYMEQFIRGSIKGPMEI